MYILTSISKTMLFESDRAYLQAGSHNLKASALAWAQKNANTKKASGWDKTITLDITDTGIDNAALSLVMEKPENKKIQVEITTLCTRSRQKLTHTAKYQIQL